MTRAEHKRLERILILRTIINYGEPVHAATIADTANEQCDHDALEALPPISRRGITMKLQGMSLDGLVWGHYPGFGEPMVWDVTDRGRALAAGLERERQ